MKVVKEEFRLEVVLEKGNTYLERFNEFKEAIKLIENERGNYGYPRKILCIYSEPAEIYSRRKIRTVTQAEVNFFTSSRTGQLCYRTTSRTGYHIENMSFEKVEKLVLIHPNCPEEVKKREKQEESFWKRVQREKYDENTWSNLKKGSFFPSQFKFINITKIFSPWEIEQIERAFKEKSKFNYYREGVKRDFTINGEMCQDGIYRAWYSSEYSGCGNGDYYLLLNPRIAVFCEHD